jgi:prefoldin subunit 5
MTIREMIDLLASYDENDKIEIMGPAGAGLFINGECVLEDEDC